MIDVEQLGLGLIHRCFLLGSVWIFRSNSTQNFDMVSHYSDSRFSSSCFLLETSLVPTMPLPTDRSGHRSIRSTQSKLV